MYNYYSYSNLPVPVEGMNTKYYMAWLEMMSQSVPPCIFVRGNHENVISFDM